MNTALGIATVLNVIACLYNLRCARGWKLSMTRLIENQKANEIYNNQDSEMARLRFDILKLRKFIDNCQYPPETAHAVVKLLKETE